jgi:hypothetical protein
MYKKYIAIDQYGNHRFIDEFPRKELTQYHGVKHADKMYRDTSGGGEQHVGYVVSGHWYEIMKLSPLEGE